MRGQRPATSRGRPRDRRADTIVGRLQRIRTPSGARSPFAGAGEPGEQASLENSGWKQPERSRHETGISARTRRSGVGKHPARGMRRAQWCASGKNARRTSTPRVRLRNLAVPGPYFFAQWVGSGAPPRRLRGPAGPSFRGAAAPATRSLPDDSSWRWSWGRQEKPRRGDRFCFLQPLPPSAELNAGPPRRLAPPRRGTAFGLAIGKCDVHVGPLFPKSERLAP
jgi:hypothetical protein